MDCNWKFCGLEIGSRESIKPIHAILWKVRVFASWKLTPLEIIFVIKIKEEGVISSFSWREIERGKGIYNWKTLKRRIVREKRRNKMDIWKVLRRIEVKNKKVSKRIRAMTRLRTW